MMATFERERQAFEQLKRNCYGDARVEFERVLEFVVKRYNTTIYENRFVVGGVIELITLALLRHAGVRCESCGVTERRGDIRLLDAGNRLFSVKASLTGVGPVRLINKQGKGNRAWDTATLFIVAGVGIVFGAPNVIDVTIHVDSDGDAIMLRKSGLKEFIDDSDNVIGVSVPYKPPTSDSEHSLVASTAVAATALNETASHTLKRLLADTLRPST